ncbi:hypothetical protein I7648_06450 [Collinsella tanakaei]|nr:hypothetical protein [Collinsella tanakaei]
MDWNRDGHVSIGEGAVSEMLINELSGSDGGAPRDSGGCGCGCLLVFLVVCLALVLFVLLCSR